MYSAALTACDPETASDSTGLISLARPDVTIAVRQGATRCLVHEGYAPIWEFSLANNRRADICGLSQKGQLVIVEVKSGIGHCALRRTKMAGYDCPQSTY